MTGKLFPFPSSTCLPCLRPKTPRGLSTIFKQTYTCVHRHRLPLPATHFPGWGCRFLCTEGWQGTVAGNPAPGLTDGLGFACSCLPLQKFLPSPTQGTSDLLCHRLAPACLSSEGLRKHEKDGGLRPSRLERLHILQVIQRPLPVHFK